MIKKINYDKINKQKIAIECERYQRKFAILQPAKNVSYEKNTKCHKIVISENIYGLIAINCTLKPDL